MRGLQSDLRFYLVLFCLYIGSYALNNKAFPSDFKLGLGSSSFQIEGAWNEDGKGESMWDRFIHENVYKVADQSNADIADDAYHKYLEDVQLLKKIGVDYYRISLSWPRILPNGTVDYINQAGIDYYLNVFKALKENGIEAMVTLYHWDLPQPFNEIGGWTNESIVDYFGGYARVAYTYFGDYVKKWATVNEPHSTCMLGYGQGIHAPGHVSLGQELYQCAYLQLKAHAKAYHIYEEEFKATQKGQVSIAIDGHWAIPEDESSAGDIDAQNREMQFEFGWYANAIYSADGNWPQVMIDRIAARSKAEGFSESRLPAFTDEEVAYIKGTSDFFSLNYYTSFVVKSQNEDAIGTPNFYSDKGVTTYQNTSWPVSASSWLRSYPYGLRALAKWIKENYNNPEIVVTECGWSDTGDLNDEGRIQYYENHLSAILDAIYEDDVNISAFTAWSFMDNFEWMEGYSQRFGIVQVDFTNDDRPRTMKNSAYWYQNLTANRCLTDSCS